MVAAGSFKAQVGRPLTPAGTSGLDQHPLQITFISRPVLHDGGIPTE